VSVGRASEPTGQVPELDVGTVAKLSSLVAIGRKSGDTVVGLSAVRRSRGLAYVFVDAGIASGTLRELGRLEQRGTRVFRVGDLEALTRAFGREDVRVVGIRRGHLARGIAQRLGE